MTEIKTDHYVTVAKLRELLAGQPDGLLVVMSKDGEGNGFSPFTKADTDRYIAESSWSGYLADEEDLYADDGDGTDETPGVPCLVLWPTN